MIISASRRTDVPGFYSEWLEKRLAAGHVLVRNPFNSAQVGRVSLAPEVVDGIVLWTKNPIPMLGRMGMLDRHSWYMQYTLNAYGRGVERRLPDMADRIEAFRRLSRDFGAARMVWRYDPLFFGPEHTVEWHAEAFSRLAGQLAGCTDTVCTSFMHMYAKTRRNTAGLKIHPGEPAQQLEVLGRMRMTAARNGMELRLCATPDIQEASGVPHAVCVDAARLSRISGVQLKEIRDPGQRKDCRCAPSVDIGAYDTCGHGCAYCYAAVTDRRACGGLAAHDPASEMLGGSLREGDVVTERRMPSLAKGPRQLSMLD